MKKMKIMLIAGTALLAVAQLSADFVKDYPEARKLFILKPAEAQAKLEKLLTESITPVQKDQILSDLVMVSCRQRKFAEAEKYIEQIAEKPLQKYNQMRLLNAQPAKRRQVIAQFEKEDFSQWPERLAYLGHYERAYAYSQYGKYKETLADAEKALAECGSNMDVRLPMLQLAGLSCQRLKDNAKALKFYEEILKTKFYGSGNYLTSAVACAEIYIADKRFEDAEKVLTRIRKTHRGYYTALVCRSFGNLYAAQGKNTEAAEYYQKCISEKGAPAYLRKSAEEKLKNLQK